MLSRAQMAPDGGLLWAKMAPAGTQTGSSNLINAGTELTQRLEERIKRHITWTQRAHVCVCLCANPNTCAVSHKHKKTKPFGSSEVEPGPWALFTAADLIHSAVWKIKRKTEPVVGETSCQRRKKKKNTGSAVANTQGIGMSFLITKGKENIIWKPGV